MNAPFVLQLFGLILEIVGVFSMANGYLSLFDTSGGRLRLLLSALTPKGDVVRGAQILRDADGASEKESYRGVLRGLALIGLGFVLQAIALIVSWLVVPPPA